MLKTKRNCTFAIYVAFLTFVFFSAILSYYVIKPTLQSISSFNDFCIIPDAWPYLPAWAILVMAILPIVTSLWITGVLLKIRTRVISPFVKCGNFLEELANDNIPAPLLRKDKYGYQANHVIANLNTVRDRISNNIRRKEAAEERESAARAKLDSANELKSLIISRLTPDIRMPLTSIRGYAEILKAKSADNDCFKTELDGIAANTVVISKIVSRIISFSKIGHQQMEINSSHFRTSELLELLIQSNDDLLKERDVELVNIYDSSTPELLYTDHELLMQTLLLLIRSVFRASEHGEAIHLCCSSDNEKVYFTVKDTKRCPCREKLAELYNFHESECDAEYLKDASSTMLGTFFAANLVEYIGGELSAASDEESHNKFILTFNKFDILSAENEAELRKQGFHDTLKLTSSSNLIAGKNYLPGTLTIPNKISDVPMRRVLIGEDNVDNAAALSEYLELFRFETVCCDNARHLLEMAKSETFDAIILSNSMRHRYLLDIIKTIRSQSDGMRLPIIVLVTKLNNRKEAELQELKVSSILLKPISFAALVNRLNQLCSYQQ